MSSPPRPRQSTDSLENKRKSHSKKKHYESGSAKRAKKEKDLRDQVASSCVKLSSFFQLVTDKSIIQDENPKSLSTSSSYTENITPSQITETVGVDEAALTSQSTKNLESSNENIVPGILPELEESSKAILSRDQGAGDTGDYTEDCSVSDAVNPIIMNADPESNEPTSDASVTQNDPNISSLSYLFCPPKPENVKQFLEFHPHQPAECDVDFELPFTKSNVQRIYFREETNEGRKNPTHIKREWISYCSSQKSFYCFLCLLYNPTTGSSFTSGGCNDWKRIHQRIKEHEMSKSHIESCRNFVREQKGKSIDSFLNTNLLNRRKGEVEKRHLVFKQVIQVVKLICKQGLAFRGKRMESAYFLEDKSVNHGNFLEILLLMAENNPVLKEHVTRAIQDSKKKKLQNKRGRGSSNTFLSKNTFLQILFEIKNLILKKISEKISKAGLFSVMMDSTTDISGFDQCSIAVRFVNDEAVVEERVVGLKKADSATGLSLFELLKKTLKENDIDMNFCIADSFDGAANMSGQYRGVTAKLQSDNPEHVHTWCYAHVLNLVLRNCTLVVVPAITVFGVLQELRNFFQDSHKRLSVYDKAKKGEKVLKLSSIGDTRWRSRSDAMVKVFGYFSSWNKISSSPSQEQEPTAESDDDSDVSNDFPITSQATLSLHQSDQNIKSSVYVNTVRALNEIACSADPSKTTTKPTSSASGQSTLPLQPLESIGFEPKIRSRANGLLKSITSFEVILTAMTFSRIFEIVTPVSDYLQTKKLDFVQAWRQVMFIIKKLKNIQRDFHPVYRAAREFVNVMSNELGDSYVIEEELPKKRRQELTEDGIKNYEIGVYNVILDHVIFELERDFKEHGALYGDIACFDPQNFEELVRKGVPKNGLQRISKMMKLSEDEEKKLEIELKSFAEFWPEINKELSEDVYADMDENDSFDYNTTLNYLMSEDDDDVDVEGNTDKNVDLDSDENSGKCQNCFSCLLKLLKKYRMYSIEYQLLYRAYKFLLTLPCTQVTCERCFSKLKIIKTRLRSSLVQSTLESLFIANVESDLLGQVDEEEIVNSLCEKSNELRRLLIV